MIWTVKILLAHLNPFWKLRHEEKLFLEGSHEYRLSPYHLEIQHKGVKQIWIVTGKQVIF